MPSSKPPPAKRPSFTPGYGIEKKLTREMLTWAAVERALAKSRNYWIVSASTKGVPHAAPVWGLWFQGAVWFATDLKSRKGINIIANPAIVVHLESGDDVVILEGRAERITSAKALDTFADAYKKKYAFRPDPKDPNSAFFRLRHTMALAWHESNFPKSATKWSF